MRICFLARSESARSSSSSPRTNSTQGRRDFRPPARHPLENYPERICGNPFRMRICFLARSESARSSSSSPRTNSTQGRRDFRPPARHPLENYPERICGNPFRMRICFLARSESAHSSLLIHTPQAPAVPRRPWRIHRATPQHCRGAPSPGKENRRHHQKAQRLRRHPQQEPLENHNLPPSAQW